MRNILLSLSLVLLLGSFSGCLGGGSYMVVRDAHDGRIAAIHDVESHHSYYRVRSHRHYRPVVRHAPARRHHRPVVHRSPAHRQHRPSVHRAPAHRQHRPAVRSAPSHRTHRPAVHRAKKKPHSPKKRGDKRRRSGRR